MTKGSRDPGKPYYPVGSRVPRTYLLTYLLTLLSFLLGSRSGEIKRERERKERARNEPRANILRYILLLFQDFSRRTNLDRREKPIRRREDPLGLHGTRGIFEMA